MNLPHPKLPVCGAATPSSPSYRQFWEMNTSKAQLICPALQTSESKINHALHWLHTRDVSSDHQGSLAPAESSPLLRPIPPWVYQVTKADGLQLTLT